MLSVIGIGVVATVIIGLGVVFIEVEKILIEAYRSAG
jgi:hypothetical protein